jgi:hypothetical protein
MDMELDKELLKRADKIRQGYKSVETDEEEEQLSFLDELNALVRHILKGEPVDIYTLLAPKELEKWKKAKLKRRVKRLLGKIFNRNSLYFLLLATITVFLVAEALPFYAIAGLITAKTYVKAILTEVCFVFLAGYRSAGRMQTFLVSILRASMFCLMLFVISSEVSLEGARDISKIDNIASRIERLETQITKTEVDIERYRSIDWPRNMTTSIRKREALEEQVQTLRSRQETEGASEGVSALIQYKTYGKAVFRLILMFVSILITRRLWRF